MAKKDKKIESTGTMDTGVAWSTAPNETEDGARIVYVGVPNEDTLRATREHLEREAEQKPRINALTTVLSLHAFDRTTPIEDVLADAAKVEEYIRSGTVPQKGASEVEDPEPEGDD